MAKSKIDTNQKKEVKQKDIKILLASGITQVKYNLFLYLIPYLQDALKQIEMQAKIDIKIVDRTIMLPYTVYNRFCNDYKIYCKTFHYKDIIRIIWEHYEIGHFKQSPKYWTHKCSFDNSIALEHTDKGETAYGDNYYFTNTGIILHYSNFDSSFV